MSKSSLGEETRPYSFPSVRPLCVNVKHVLFIPSPVTTLDPTPCTENPLLFQSHFSYVSPPRQNKSWVLPRQFLDETLDRGLLVSDSRRTYWTFQPPSSPGDESVHDE